MHRQYGTGQKHTNLIQSLIVRVPAQIATGIMSISHRNVRAQEDRPATMATAKLTLRKLLPTLRGLCVVSVFVKILVPKEAKPDSEKRKRDETPGTR